MKEYIKDVGKVVPTVEGDWNINHPYDVLSIVYDDLSNKSYISRKIVPIGISILNKEYWQRFGQTRIDNDSILSLSYKDKNGAIVSYTLEEAINSISIEDRRCGLFINFYEKPTSMTDTYHWNIYQFNSNDTNNFTDITAWVSVYYNDTKFFGLFPNVCTLYNVKINPDIGDYAFVGPSLDKAVVYKCYTKNIWTETKEKAINYITILIEGNVSIGENGNWYNNGLDTGIPAKGDKGDRPFIRLNQETGDIEYSYDEEVWDLIINKEDIRGIAATIKVGEVETLDPGFDVEVTNSGDEHSAVFNFKIPKGEIGDGLIIKGFGYSNIEELKSEIINPSIGDAYIINNNEPYHLCIYTNINNEGVITPDWKDLGEVNKNITLISQTIGNDKNITMSQKTITDLYNELKNRLVVLSDEEYEALEVKDENVFYFIYEEL